MTGRIDRNIYGKERNYLAECFSLLDHVAKNESSGFHRNLEEALNGIGLGNPISFTEKIGTALTTKKGADLELFGQMSAVLVRLREIFIAEGVSDLGTVRKPEHEDLRNFITGNISSHDEMSKMLLYAVYYLACIV